jgi:hypothetical protein
MKKIPTVFLRNPEDLSKLLNEQNPECAWVFAGEGIATRKYDGACCMIRDGVLYKRREFKGGVINSAGFEILNYDSMTDKTVGWVKVGFGPEDCWFREAYLENLEDGTYELLGPKVQGNPECCLKHYLHKHSEASVYPGIARDFEGLRQFLSSVNMEGLVWHHPDGRMAKIKKRDFGMRR